MKKLFLLSFTLCLLSNFAHAKEKSPQHFSTEFKGGFWVPQNSTVQSFLGKCCNGLVKLEFGYLWDSKLGFELAVGGMIDDGKGVGITSGGASQDTLSFILVPIQNNITFRADFKEDQLFVPYVKLGSDYVYFKEKIRGTTTQGMKYGGHGTVGLQILMEWFEDLTYEMETEMGINDLYLTLEAQYAIIGKSVFGSGLDLSGYTFTAGLLFEF